MYKLVNWPTVVEGDPKTPFSIATKPKCSEGANLFPLFLNLPLIHIL